MNILIIGAASDESILKALRDARRRWPRGCCHILRPSGRPLLDAGPAVRVLDASSDPLRPEHLAAAGACDVALLVLSHVGRNDYPAFVRSCCALAKECFLFSPLGWQRLDARDAESGWPEKIPSSKRLSHPGNPRSWVFFRPSDRTAHYIASSLQEKGVAVLKVETLAELEAVMPQTDAVFFDWCITHYSALFQAVRMAIDHEKHMEALVSLDIADLAEEPDMARHLMEINQSALPRMDHIHYLASRKFILERYGINAAYATGWWNQADAAVWRADTSRLSRRGKNDPIRLVYHGLFYPWHEVAEFLPVLQALTARMPVRFDLFGRVHESLFIAGESLFPRKEKQVRDAVSRMAEMPGVEFHAFSTTEKILEAMAAADFYIGITAASSLMSESEIRTGEEEAWLAGIRLLRKATPATALRCWIPGQDFLDVNSLEPDKAADIIIRTGVSPVFST